MDISITGVRNPKFKKELMRAAEFYLSSLVSKRLLNHITLEIDVKRRSLMDEEADGYCEIEGYNTNKKPREFLIEIAKDRSVRYMLMTLAHEIVHLKQYALGEINEEMNTWKGKRYTNAKAYWNTPWEIEAYGRERGLYYQYCEEYGVKFEKTEKERDN